MIIILLVNAYGKENGKIIFNKTGASFSIHVIIFIINTLCTFSHKKFNIETIHTASGKLTIHLIKI